MSDDSPDPLVVLTMVVGLILVAFALGVIIGAHASIWIGIGAGFAGVVAALLAAGLITWRHP